MTGFEISTTLILKIYKLFIMVDVNSPEYQIEKKIGYVFMTYIGIRLIIKGTRIVIKSGRVLLNYPMPTP